MTISRKRPAKTGETTKVTVTCKDGSKEYTKEVYVKNKRNPVVRFNCGSPELESVKAVLYSNGNYALKEKGMSANLMNFHGMIMKQKMTS